MKKYLILAAAAALTVVSCTKFETYTVSENDGLNPIGFTNYSPKSLVKAGDTYVPSTTLIANKQFAVYAWNTAYGSFLGVNPGAPGFMNPAVVTYKSDDTDGDGNTYEPVRYWPSGDEPENLSFTAYYPYGGAGITAPTFATGVGTYAFTAQGAAADMVDFCVADVVNDQTYGHTNKSASGYDGTVNLPFKHQLAKIQFKFKKASDVANTTVIELIDAKLQDIKTTGTLTATYAQNASPAVNALGTTTTAWSNVATPAAYEIFVNEKDVTSDAANKVVLTTTATSVEDSEIFLMIPQAMIDKAAANPQKLQVKWNVKIYDTAAHATANGAEGLISSTENTKTLYFKNDLKNGDDPTDPAYDALDLDWAKNNFITYTITIGPKPIWFTATVAAWDGEVNGYFNVN